MHVSFRTTLFFVSFVFSFLFLYTNSFAETIIGLSNSPVDQTLDPSITYVVEGEVSVLPDTTLTIPAGTHLMFKPEARVIVHGTLIAQGTNGNHIVMELGGNTAVPVTIQSQTIETETQSAEVLPEVVVPEETTETSEVQTSDIAPTITNTVMMAEEIPVSSKHLGINFLPGSTGTMDYVDISNATNGVVIAEGATATLDHDIFKNCDIGILGAGGDITLHNTTFDTVLTPAAWDFHGIFIHSNTTFINTDLKGWRYEGGRPSDTVIKLDSTDGEYELFSMSFQKNFSLEVGPGVTIRITKDPSLAIDGGSLKMNGTKDNPITIYGNGDCSVDHPAITVGRGGVADMQYVHFRNLCSGILASVESTINLNHDTFDSISNVAIFDDSGTSISLVNSTISKSGTALQLKNASIKNISYNNFEDNNTGVSLADMSKADIAHNWWGSKSGPRVDDNPDGEGNSIVYHNVSKLIYRPWLGMEQGDSEDKDPSDSPEHNPIIIVPGITGSVLTKDYDDKSELWPNIAKLVTSPADSFLNDLELLQDGSPSNLRPLLVGDVIRSIDSADIFKSLITTLSQNGYTEGKDLFVLPYDWRLSNTINQSLLQGAINDALVKSGKTKVTIIAHSMGGLLVKDYLAKNPTAPIDNIFNIAVPHLGAPKAFKTLMYGDDMGFNFSVGPLQIPILNAGRTKTISQNMPSVYELLPSEKYFQTIGSYVSDLFDGTNDLDTVATKSFMIEAGRNEKLFPFAQALHSETDNLDVSKIHSYDFVGCGATKTISSYLITRKQSISVAGLTLVPEYRLGYSQGDGVVPMNSANAGNGAINYYSTAGSHGTMPSVSDIQRAIVNILTGKAVATSSTFTTDAKNCATAGDIVEIHSPVKIDIYDEQGNHTGPDADGNIENAIPGVQYDMLGDEKFVFLPAGPLYKVLLKAEAVGTFDMYISHSDDHDAITSVQYFNELPIKNEKLEGEMMIGNGYTDIGQPNQIDIDKDGDGEFEDNFFPASIFLDETHINDHTPPVTTAMVSGTTVTLTAQDNNGRILKTKYSTDGVSWSIYTKPFQLPVGAIAQFFSIDLVGNVESIQHVTASSDNSNTKTPVNSVDKISSSSINATSGGGVTAQTSVLPVISQLVSAATEYAKSDQDVIAKVHAISAVVKTVAPEVNLTAIDTIPSTTTSPGSSSLLSRMFPKELLASAFAAVKTGNKVIILASLGAILITAIIVLIKNGK